MKYVFLFALISFNALGQFDTIKNTKVIRSEKNSSIQGFYYAYPTESSPGNFLIPESLAMPENALLVSVGTFRTLILFAWLPNIKYLIMTDINNQIEAFNHRHLGYIKTLSEEYPHNIVAQRMHYFANFSGYDISKEQAILWAQEKKELQEIKDVIKDLDPALLGFKEDSIWRRTMAPDDYLLTTLHKSSNNLFGYNKVGDEQFYWENDGQWQKIIDAIDSSCIATANWDLVEDFDAIDVFTHQTGIELGAVDVSNIADAKNRTTNNPGWAKKLKTASKGKSVVFYTRWLRGSFSYHLSPWEKFINYLEIIDSLQ